MCYSLLFACGLVCVSCSQRPPLSHGATGFCVAGPCCCRCAYRCVNGRGYAYVCQDGLQFNNAIQACDWPYNMVRRWHAWYALSKAPFVHCPAQADSTPCTARWCQSCASCTQGSSQSFCRWANASTRTHRRHLGRRHLPGRRHRRGAHRRPARRPARRQVCSAGWAAARICAAVKRPQSIPEAGCSSPRMFPGPMCRARHRGRGRPARRRPLLRPRRPRLGLQVTTR